MAKTVLQKVVVAIRAVQDHKGASRQAVVKYLKAELDCANAAAIKGALKKGVSGGTLVQTGQSFRVAGDAIIAPPADETVGIEDLEAGAGAAAARGDDVVVDYVGALVDGGAEFDRGKSFAFSLGGGDVIKGWDRGVAGMRAGGRRILTCPPKLAYGAKGSAPDIPPHAALRFDVTLVSIT